MNRKIVIYTGAGISVDSGISTFRGDNESLYSNSEFISLLSVEGLKTNPVKVFELHNELREKIRHCRPNSAHSFCYELEQKYDVTVITTNVDNLHEQAGSTNVLHLHGELMKSRLMDDDSTKPTLMDCSQGLNYGDTLEDGLLLRPHTVLFGEYPYNIEQSIKAISECDVLIIIGTSFDITYTASIVASANREGVVVYYIDPNPQYDLQAFFDKTPINFIETTATEGVKTLTI